MGRDEYRLRTRPQSELDVGLFILDDDRGCWVKAQFRCRLQHQPLRGLAPSTTGLRRMRANIDLCQFSAGRFISGLPRSRLKFEHCGVSEVAAINDHRPVAVQDDDFDECARCAYEHELEDPATRFTISVVLSPCRRSASTILPPWRTLRSNSSSVSAKGWLSHLRSRFERLAMLLQFLRQQGCGVGWRRLGVSFHVRHMFHSCASDRLTVRVDRSRPRLLSTDRRLA
jgi:hypothetical protein